jgi:hypothetical protein
MNTNAASSYEWLHGYIRMSASWWTGPFAGAVMKVCSGSNSDIRSGLDAIFEVEKGSPFAREAPRRFSGTRKIVVWKTQALCARVGAETIGGVP